MHVPGVAAVSIAFLLLPGVAAAQKDAGKAPAPAGRWIVESARGIRATEAGVELRQGAGWVFTSAIFADFTLDLEFRIIDHGTRASLFVRAFPLERPTYGSYSINLSDAVGGTTPLGSIASGKRDLIADVAVTEARRAATRATAASPACNPRCAAGHAGHLNDRCRSTERRGGRWTACSAWRPIRGVSRCAA